MVSSAKADGHRELKMRQLPTELQSIDCPALRRAIEDSAIQAAENWNIDAHEASEIIIERLVENRVSRKTISSAKRYLREIPEYEEN